MTSVPAWCRDAPARTGHDELVEAVAQPVHIGWSESLACSVAGRGWRGGGEGNLMRWGHNVHHLVSQGSKRIQICCGGSGQNHLHVSWKPLKKQLAHQSVVHGVCTRAKKLPHVS